MSQSNQSALWECPKNFYIDGKVNKQAACREIDFPILKVKINNFKDVMKIFKKFSPDLIKFDKSKKFDGTSEYKGIILDPSKLNSIHNELSDKESVILKQLDIEFNDHIIEFMKINVVYDNYKLSTLFDWILPDNQHLTGFTIIGHIVHLNLKEEFYPLKYIIGEMILDKVSGVTTVVSKLNKIDTEFRTFALELLAGEEQYVTTIKENGFQFKFDFSKVYWNSRLSTEHCRVIDSLRKDDVVYDACAGVGPFAIPAAKKGCKVVANDLNDESCKWFKTNMEINSKKSRHLPIDLHNLDAGDFIEKIMIPHIIEIVDKSEKLPKFHLIMNLPSIAVDFLSAIVANDQIEYITRSDVFLHVNCYCFIGKEIPKETIEEKINTQLRERVKSVNLRFVRNVSPSKDMFCAEIIVNLSAISGNFEAESKRRKLDE